jgi:hypothetical protein
VLSQAGVAGAVLVARRRHRKPEPTLYLASEVQARREKDAEGWRKRAEEERGEGLDGREAGGRWIAARDAGRAYRPQSRWRTKPVSIPQTQKLRRLGLNPLAYRNAGEASDAISKAGTGTKR